MTPEELAQKYPPNAQYRVTQGNVTHGKTGALYTAGDGQTFTLEHLQPGQIAFLVEVRKVIERVEAVAAGTGGKK